MPEPITFSDLATITWEARSIVCRLLRPARVLSTSRTHGGTQQTITAAINHQICEPGRCATDTVCEHDLDAYIDDLSRALGCDPDRTVTMLTAASAGHAGWARRAFEGVHVLSVVTAGVAENAARAGDPAEYHETADGWRQSTVPPTPGTINALLLVDHPLTPGALVKAGVMLTEAKSAALQALLVRSRSGPGIATGSGTDQYVIVCPAEGGFALGEAQAHTKLGQMIAETVDEALRVSLERQNDLSPMSQASVSRVLARFGGTIEPGAWDTDPQAVAAAAALATVFDLLRWGILRAEDRARVVARHAAILACAVAGSRAGAHRAEDAILQPLVTCPGLPDGRVVEVAVALGMARRTSGDG